MEYEIYRVDELTHWGVKGMRWGVRRYQNKDGSLTPRGKKRYDAELKKVREQEKVLKTRQATRDKIERLEARKKAAVDKKAELDEAEGKNKKSGLFKRKQKAGEPVKKSIKDMDDLELYNAINRARMEDTYQQLRPDKVEKPKVFGQLINDVVKPAAVNAGKQVLENALKQAGSEMLKKTAPTVSDMVKENNKMTDDEFDALVRASHIQFYKEAVKGKGVKPDKKKKGDEDDD